MNILLAGIPVRPMREKIRSRYPGDLTLYIAECRPYEEQVAREISAFPYPGMEATLLTDNMMAALMESVPIDAVWIQSMEISGTHAVCVNGAHMAALLARSYEIPCLLYPVSGLAPGGAGRFAGDDITVAGAAYIPWEPDIVPIDLIGEIIVHGNDLEKGRVDL